MHGDAVNDTTEQSDIDVDETSKTTLTSPIQDVANSAVQPRNAVAVNFTQVPVAEKYEEVGYVRIVIIITSILIVKYRCRLVVVVECY